MEGILKNRLSIANLPTPVHYLPRLSEEFGVELFVKRDDLTESVASGNKIRKLEYVLYDAMAQGADTLVTCGGVQSNHCRAVAWIAAKMGLDCVLLLRGEHPGFLQGNLLLDSLLGAKFRFFSHKEFKNIKEIQNNVCLEIKEKGRHSEIMHTFAFNDILFFTVKCGNIVPEDRKEFTLLFSPVNGLGLSCIEKFSGLHTYHLFTG